MEATTHLTPQAIAHPARRFTRPSLRTNIRSPQAANLTALVAQAAATPPPLGFDARQLLPAENPDPEARAEAWQTCWEAISPPVLKYIRLKNGTSADDHDILADAMTTAYLEVEGGRYEYRAGIPFTAYVKGIARNLIRDTYRHERRNTPLDDDGEHPHLIDDSTPLEDLIAAGQAREAIRQVAAELTPRRRDVLLLYSEGYDTAQIAARLDISTDLVRQEKTRAIKHLKRRLHDLHALRAG
jgi:RNA polymerase sigma factor (sigma-70 family)